MIIGLALAAGVTGRAMAASGSGGTALPPPDFILGTSVNPGPGLLVPGGFPTCPAYYGCAETKNWEPRELVFFDFNTGYWGQTVVLISQNGFAGTVTLEILGLPPGVTSQTAATATLTAGATVQTPLVLQAATSAALGDSVVTVRATSGALVHETSYAIRVVDPLPPPPPTVSAPLFVVGGGQYQATAALMAPAPLGGLVLNLSTSDPAVATVPASVTIPAGETVASFTATTAPVTARAAPDIQAVISPNGWMGSNLMFVDPSATLDQIAVFPTSVISGDTSAVSVALSAAVAEPTVVALSSSDPAVAMVPASLTVPAGSSSSFAPIPTTAGAAGIVTVSATFGGVTRAAVLTVGNPDSLTFKTAQYDSAKQVLQVEVTSTSATATLTASVSATGQLIGMLSNAGGGTYKAVFAWPVNPQTITVKSSQGGAGTTTVVAK